MIDNIDFGPQEEAVKAILDKYPTLTIDQKHEMRDLRDDAFWEGWNVALGGRAARAGLRAAQVALFDQLSGGWFGGGNAAYGAALAVLLRHTFTEEERVHYDALVKPWVTVTGQPAHPDDVEAAETGTLEVADELAALNVLVTVIDPLDAAQRRRVLGYLNDRFSEVA